jgi:hypothetical protein
MYAFRFGSNVVKNLRLFAGETILPVSTVTVLQAGFYLKYLLLICVSIFTSIYVILLGFGLWKSDRKYLVKRLCILILCSWFPAILLNHISELYIYNSLFYLAVLFGISAEYYWEEMSKRPSVVFACVCLLFLIAGITNTVGVDEKASLMKKEGDRAAILLPQIILLTKHIPEKEWIYLVGQQDSGFGYSKFVSPCFDVLYNADTLVRYYADRLHSHYFIGDSAKCAENAKEHPGIAFICDPKSFTIYPIIPNFTAQKINRLQ